jgi:hypothetical protein
MAQPALLYCTVRTTLKAAGTAIVLCAVFIPAAAQVSTTNYVWADLDAGITRRHTTYSALLSLRSENNGSHLYQRRIQFGASRMLPRQVAIGANYVFITSRSAGDPNVFLEHRWRVYAIPRVRTVAGITISDRNMVEFRRISGVLSYRYRNRLQVERHFGRERYSLTPYIGLEPIYDTRWKSWNKQPDACLGVLHPFSRHVSMDLFYRRQADSRPNLYLHNIVSATLRLRY